MMKSAQRTACVGTPPITTVTTSTHSPVIPYATAKSRTQYRLQPRVAAQTCQPPWLVEKVPTTIPVLSDEQIVTGLSEAMNAAAVRNTNDSDMPSWEDRISVFFSVSKPEIETVEYIKRLVKYAECSRSAFAIVLVYLSRLEKANGKLGITYYNMHRLLITALMLAAKMLDDRCYSNAHYARVGGISSVKEVNRLEIEMLILLDYKLIVTPEEYTKFVLNVQKQYISRSPAVVNPPQLVQHHASSHVSHRSVPGCSYKERPVSQQAYTVQQSYPSYTFNQPHRSQYASEHMTHHQSPHPIQTSDGLAENAFNAHSTNNTLNLNSFADALKTLAIPQCTEMSLSTLLSTGSSVNIGWSEFFEIIPSVLAAAAFSRADIKGTGLLDVRGFRAALDILGIGLPYFELHRHFKLADRENTGYVGPEAFTSVLRNIVSRSNINLNLMLTSFRKGLDEGLAPDYGLVGVAAEIASAAFAAVDSEKIGILDIGMFKDALHHLNISMEKNYDTVFRYFTIIDKEMCFKITKEKFIALFAFAEEEAIRRSNAVGCTAATMEYGSISATAQGPVSHTMASNYNSVHRIYKFEAPGQGHEFQVLPLHDRQDAKQSGSQYSCAGVRSRVYR